MRFTNPLDWPLYTGATPLVLIGLGLLALLALLYRRDRGWWRWWVPLAVVAAALLAVGLGWFVDKLWRPFPDELPTSIVVWLGVILLGLLLMVLRMRRARWWVRLGLILAALLVLVAGVSRVNAFYQQYPTIRAAFGPLFNKSKPLPVTGTDKPITAAPGQVLEDVWRPPASMPSKGVLSETPLPGASSGFRPRNAWVYTPPAYQVTPRPLLPVLVLLSGQPGSPRDWIDAGDVVGLMDTFAAAHRGLAPVVIMPDMLGEYLANPMCLDSKLGNVQTYLAKDVPDWVQAHLQVSADPNQWAVGGLSSGGTCSLQLAVNAPQVYRAFIDISGQDEPTLSTRAETVAKAFGGDEAAFVKVNPLDIMKTRRFPQTGAFLVAGQQDSVYLPQQRAVRDACLAAGMAVQYDELPGGHSMQVWRPGLADGLPWLAKRVGLIRA